MALYGFNFFHNFFYIVSIVFLCYGIILRLYTLTSYYIILDYVMALYSIRML